MTSKRKMCFRLGTACTGEKAGTLHKILRAVLLVHSFIYAYKVRYF